MQNKAANSLFAQNLRHLRINAGMSQAKLGELVGSNRGNIDGYERGRAEPPLRVLLSIAEIFSIEVGRLLTADLATLAAQGNAQVDAQNHQKVHGESVHGDSDSLAAYQNAYDDVHIGQKVHNESVRLEPSKEVSIVYGDLKPQARKNAIPIIQQKAAAGTIHGFSDPEYVESLPVILFPGLSSGFAVQIQGDSMHPTVKPGDYVIFEEEPAKKLTDNRVYVVYTYDGLLVKRVLDRRATEGIIICKSDNPEHANLILRPEDIISIHAVKRRLTADFSGPQDTFQRISSLENGLYDLRSELIERLSRLESKGS